MTVQRRIRLFLNSNVVTGGIVSSWGLEKGTLSLRAAKVCRVDLAGARRDVVEATLRVPAARPPGLEADQRIEAYRRRITLTNHHWVPARHTAWSGAWSRGGAEATVTWMWG